MFDWLTDNAWWLTATGVLLWIGGMIAMIAFAVLLPAKHFVRAPDRAQNAGGHPALRIFLRVLRNIIGIGLLVLGLLASVPLVPGPGIVLLLFGLSLLDIPGKHALGRWLIRKPWVNRPINALRHRWHRLPLEIPPRPLRDWSAS